MSIRRQVGLKADAISQHAPADAAGFSAVHDGVGRLTQMFSQHDEIIAKAPADIENRRAAVAPEQRLQWAHRPRQPVAISRAPRQFANPESEEHTSELQSLLRISYAVLCLKKKKTIQTK